MQFSLGSGCNTNGIITLLFQFLLTRFIDLTTVEQYTFHICFDALQKD
jgi:hypothetical protein